MLRFPTGIDHVSWKTCFPSSYMQDKITFFQRKVYKLLNESEQKDKINIHNYINIYCRKRYHIYERKNKEQPFFSFRYDAVFLLM
ncbi:hypothetical protein D7V87_13745 [Clostridium sp. 1xD42-85]|nr:hypothetical protein D7V87_13745 [Clostridium sp. 1xD42-85]